MIGELEENTVDSMPLEESKRRERRNLGKTPLCVGVDFSSCREQFRAPSRTIAEIPPMTDHATVAVL